MHLLLAATLLLGGTLAQRVAPRQLHVGFSAEGRPIDAYWLGDGPIPVVVVGGIHDARKETRPTWCGSCSTDLPPLACRRAASACCCCPKPIQTAWPTAARAGQRRRSQPQLAHGDWTESTYGPAASRPMAVGKARCPSPKPSSLAGLIARIRPVAVVSYHSAGGFVMGGPAAERSACSRLRRRKRVSIESFLGLSRHRRLRAVVRRAGHPHRRGRVDRPRRSRAGAQPGRASRRCWRDRIASRGDRSVILGRTA